MRGDPLGVSSVWQIVVALDNSRSMPSSQDFDKAAKVFDSRSLPKQALLLWARAWSQERMQCRTNRTTNSLCLMSGRMGLQWQFIMDRFSLCFFQRAFLSISFLKLKTRETNWPLALGLSVGMVEWRCCCGAGPCPVGGWRICSPCFRECQGPVQSSNFPPHCRF